MSCSSGEIEIRTEEKFDLRLVVGVSVASVIVIGMIITFLVLKFYKKGDNVYTKYSNVFDRLGGFFGGTVSQFSIGLLIAILISDVVGSFNGLIITPLVQVAFPSQKIFRTGVNIGGERDVYMYPGQFILSLFGFILSLLILFFIIEATYQVSKLPFVAKISKYGFTMLVILLLLGLLAWNIYDVLTLETRVKCEPIPNSCEGCEVFPEGSKIVQGPVEESPQLSLPIGRMKTMINSRDGIRYG